MWFENWFSSKFYLDIYRHRNDEDARLMINLLQRTIPVYTHAKILDVACGAGRHSIELARRGFNVTGFDLSTFLIGEAKKSLEQSKERNLKVRFLIKDMRNFNFRSGFDVAMNIFTSFGYFEDDNDNFRVIQNVSASLKANGYFVFDFLNKNYLLKNIVPYSKSMHGKSKFIQKRKIINGFVRKDIIIEEGGKKKQFTEMLKLYSVSEFKKAFVSCGLKPRHLFGDYYGNKFDTNNSQRLIIFAQKI